MSSKVMLRELNLGLPSSLVPTGSSLVARRNVYARLYGILCRKTQTRNSENGGLGLYYILALLCFWSGIVFT